MNYHRLVAPLSRLALWIAVSTACITASFAQADKPSTYTEKFVSVRGIDLHYLDFGGSGVPIIFLQSFHGDAKEWVDYDAVGFAPRFVKDHRVFAITRRGWGKSTDTFWGFDVATQAEDFVAFMDALKIKKAILVGRAPANMDMTWIAEHHPDRVAGLAYTGNPVVYSDFRDPDVRKYVEVFATFAWDLGADAIRKSVPRASWRPRFMSDSRARINIPALRIEMKDRLENPVGRDVQAFDFVANVAKDPDFKHPDKAAGDYLLELSKDPERQAKLKAALVKADNTAKLNEAMERAFGKNLKTVIHPDPPANAQTEEEFQKFFVDVVLELYYKEISAFAKSIKP